jgi:hypothetical protein
MRRVRPLKNASSDDDRLTLMLVLLADMMVIGAASDQNGLL